MDGGDSVCADLHDDNDVFYCDIRDGVLIFILSLDARCLKNAVFEI